jgi:hypothetical protein
MADKTQQFPLPEDFESVMTPYWTFRENSTELIELSSTNKVQLRFPSVIINIE